MIREARGGERRERRVRLLDPGRRIADLAQEDLSYAEFVGETLALLEEAIGFETALATRTDREESLFVHNMGDDEREGALESLRLAGTRYAKDLLPVFEFSAREGAFLESQFYPSERAKRETLLFQEVMGPAGVETMFHICARWKGQRLLRIVLNRYGGRPFRQGELETALRLLPTLEACLHAREAHPLAPAVDGLSAREAEIAALVRRGLTTPQIAEVLGTSRFTIRNQLTRIYEKLDLGGRVELAAFIARHEQG